MNDVGETRLAELLRLLPPAPAEWVEAAGELPRTMRELDAIAELAEADAAFRAVVLADLETALGARGVEPRPALVSSLRRRLTR